ncbi:MAG: glutaredoxin family protein [Verrucomicrobiales bacterium]|nr:glutaredoxin family protein [Verrucomicrobiales bacterium]
MKVFIKPGCPWCVEATRWLESKGYEFEQVNVSADADAFADMQSLSGQTKAPTMVMEDGLILADFGVDELIPFLEENDIQP